MVQMPRRQSLMKLIFSLGFVFLVYGTPSNGFAQSKVTEGAGINWLAYMRHASSASAIAMALSYVDHCKKKLVITESEHTDPETREDTVTLAFRCAGNEDEEGTAFLIFSGSRESYADSPPTLKAFEYAG